MTTVQLDLGSALLRTLGRRALLGAVLSASWLAGALMSAGPVHATTACGSAPLWIATGKLPDSSQDPLSACFQARSNQAEALMSIASNRGYPQLITVSGTRINLEKSSFSDSLDGSLTWFLGHLSSSGRSQVLLLGPGKRATLTVDRPAPEEAAQDVRITAAQGTPSALAGLAWTFMNAAAARASVRAGIESCLASALLGAASSTHASPATVKRMRLCVDSRSSSATSAGKRLRRLASHLFSAASLKHAAALRHEGLHAADIAFTIPTEPPGPYNPNIQLDVTNWGIIADGRKTIKHLGATGGVPPYRYYVITEPGRELVPSWWALAPDGTVTIAPPVDADVKVSETVQVIDSNGERSVVVQGRAVAFP